MFLRKVHLHMSNTFIFFVNYSHLVQTHRKTSTWHTIIKMAFIKEESEDIRIAEVFSIKHEDTEEQTGWFLSQSWTQSFDSYSQYSSTEISGGQSTQIKYLSKSTDTYNKILLQ